MRQILIAIGMATTIILAFISPSAASEEIDTLRKDCESGSFNSCNDLGYMYFYGQDIDKDVNQAIFYTRKACDGGNSTACSNLGSWYFHGDVEGIERDEKQAIELFQKACDGGEFKQCVKLGWEYLDGKIVKQNYALALQNFQMACSKGVFAKGEGCYGVAEIHMDGLGVEKDIAKGIKFFNTACDANDADGCAAMAEIYDEGVGVEPDLRKSVAFYGKACHAGDSVICVDMGVMYEEGSEVDRDLALAALFYRTACEKKNIDGCDNQKRLNPGQICPCFSADEIVEACPRPDAGHTERYISAENGSSLNIKCFASRNYSPGSIWFEIGDGNNGREQFCARQSVEVAPYGSGGIFPKVSSEVFAACKQALDKAAKKLGIQLVEGER